MSKKLTVGMATYDDYDGVFFSIQALKMYHEPCKDAEFIVLDGNPSSEHGKECKKFVESTGGRYFTIEETPSSFNKYKIADYATADYVLIMDCHVMIEQGGVERLLDYFEKNPNCKDLVQGPLWYDDLKNFSTNFKPVWSGDMFGVWDTNMEAYQKGEPFEIQLQGMGLLAFERKNWPGICPHFRGFGAEEGYISEKFRLNGGKNICLPGLKWNHRFGRPNGVKYPLWLEDRLWNYTVGWMELYKNPEHEMLKSMMEHFGTRPQLIPTMNNFLEQAKEMYG